MGKILEHLYDEDHLSYKKIAGILEADPKSVRGWAKQAGIKSRNRKESYQYLGETSPTLFPKHLDLCLCPHCKGEKLCGKGRAWHEKGFCLMACNERR